MELPQSEFPDDDIDIQDYSDVPDYDQLQGLSDQQVSEIAKDSLNAASGRRYRPGTDKGPAEKH